MGVMALRYHTSGDTTIFTSLDIRHFPLAVSDISANRSQILPIFVWSTESVNCIPSKLLFTIF